jgi:hypothetical protein
MQADGTDISEGRSLGFAAIILAMNAAKSIRDFFIAGHRNTNLFGYSPNTFKSIIQDIGGLSSSA